MTTYSPQDRAKLLTGEKVDYGAFPNVSRIVHRDADEAQAESAPSFTFHRVVDRAHILDEPMEWLVRGYLVKGTPTVIGGAKKTLKSITTMHLAVAVAAGVPLFGELEVPEPRPVAYLVGEGGERQAHRRFQRIAEAYGLDSVPKDIHYSTEPFAMTANTDHLHTAIGDIGAALVVVDPFYRYRGTGVQSSDLFEMGRVLADFTAPLTEAGITTAIVHHFKSSAGKEPDLDNLSMSGGAEFADSWLMLNHRETPDPEAGLYKLNVLAGSREFGQRSYRLDYDDGPFDDDTMRHVRLPSWALRRAGAAPNGGGDGGDGIREAILAKVIQYPGELVRTELTDKRDSRGFVDIGNRDDRRSVLGNMIASGELEFRKEKRAGDRELRDYLYARGTPDRF